MPLTSTLKENEVPSVPQSSVSRAGLFSLSFSALDSHVSARPRILKEGKAQNQKQDHPILVAPKLQFRKQSSYKLKTDNYKVILYRPPQRDKLTLSEAAITVAQTDLSGLQSLHVKIFQYMSSRHLSKIQSLKDYLQQALPQTECEKSAVFTLGVLPDNADNIDSLKSILDHLHDCMVLEHTKCTMW